MSLAQGNDTAPTGRTSFIKIHHEYQCSFLNQGMAPHGDKFHFNYSIWPYKKTPFLVGEQDVV